jgi:hypothetical protein
MGGYFSMKLGTVIVNLEKNIFTRSLFRSRSKVKVIKYEFTKKEAALILFLMKLGIVKEK